MADFVKIQTGPSSYPSTGFEIQVGEYEKLQDVGLVMSPAQVVVSGVTLLATADVDSKSGNVATIKVLKTTSTADATLGAFDAGSSLATSEFILTGQAI